MNSNRSASLVAAMFVGLLASPAFAAVNAPPETGPRPEAAGGAARPAAAPLGSLAAFRAIAADTLKLVKEGDLKAAKRRITDLETAWDDAEEHLKPMSPQTWTAVDRGIDRALASLRSTPQDVAACEAALQKLIAKIDSIDKK